MSFTAVRKFAVVSFFVIGGMFIFSNVYAATAPYVDMQHSKIVNFWGTTFDDQPGNYNKGSYYAIDPVNNPDYGIMPQEDNHTPTLIDAPFDMAYTSWCPTTVDTEPYAQKQIYQTFLSDCSPATFEGRTYALNDTDHIYIALELEAAGINSADRLYLYFDPDNISPVPEFVEGSGFSIGVKLGDVTFNPGTGNTVNEAMDFCNGYWKDWDNSGSIDTWESSYPWPTIEADGAHKCTYSVNTTDKDDLTIVPRSASEWGDSTTGTFAGAYWDAPGALPNGWIPAAKTGVIMMQFKIPLEYLGCSIALGSDIGFAIKWQDDINSDDDISDCSYENAWWPMDIESAGVPNAGWEKNDAAYMGTMTLNSQNQGTRLWGPWFDVQADRTSWLVLKNVSDEQAKTKVKFYESKHGDSSERYAPLPGAGELLSSQCVVIEPHGVLPMQLETIDSGALVGKKGTIEVTNTDLAGYVVAYVGLDSGALQRYAWSVDLEVSPYTPEEWNTLHTTTTTGMMLANKWYIVGEPGWEYDTSVIVVNPSPSHSVKASVVLYPSVYWDPNVPSTPNLCADVGFHPDFDGDTTYSSTKQCGDTSADADDVINIPAHQAVQIKMWEFLNIWVAHWNPGDLGRDITDNTNSYWHLRKGTVEVYVKDGDDDATDTLGEALFGITGREASTHGWAESMQRYYE